jgi:lysophospholipid acyltransferase (LPLAT)-like uncharacterized protein
MLNFVEHNCLLGYRLNPMRWLKNLSKQPWFIRFIAWLMARYIKFVFKTNRWSKHSWDIAEGYWRERKPFIVCFWHNRSMMQMCFWESNIPFHMLNSAHRDGQLFAHTIGYFRLRTIAGSTSKRGTQALREIISALKKGDCIGITPDGPRGPRFKVSEGVIQISKLSGVDIIPCASATTRRKVWGSWDRFILALPFGRGAIVIGEPIKPPQSKEDIAKNLSLLEKRLQQVTDQADALCGHAPLR